MLLFELIQVAIGSRERLSRVPSSKEWKALFNECSKQSVSGVALVGIDKMMASDARSLEYFPLELKLEWIGVGEQIRVQNKVANQRCVEVTKMFEEAGFNSCILKGQGNAMMYPNPEYRSSGDIDIWVDGKRDTITKYVRCRCPKVFEMDHHIDFPVFEDVPVEVHYKPCTLLSPKTDKRFLSWCEEQKHMQMSNRVELHNNVGSVCVPTTVFNAVFQMAHIMIHFFIEGIGLRHFIDYYYVLKSNTNNSNVTNLFEEFGLLRFARGVMWIEKECLGLEDEYLLVEPDEKRGRVILKEMLEGGNFGHYDERYKGRQKGLLARGITDTSRLLKLATVFPSESMWKIYRKIENQKWRFKNR